MAIYDSSVFTPSIQGSTLARGLRNYPKYTRDRIAQRMENLAKEAERYMRRNAPWDDRTGAARKRLRAEVTTSFEQWQRNRVDIVLSHGVSYGIWLEVRWNGKYAIVGPTLEVYGPKAMQSIERITGEIIYYA